MRLTFLKELLLHSRKSVLKGSEKKCFLPWWTECFSGIQPRDCQRKSLLKIRGSWRICKIARHMLMAGNLNWHQHTFTTDGPLASQTQCSCQSFRKEHIESFSIALSACALLECPLWEMALSSWLADNPFIPQDDPGSVVPDLILFFWHQSKGHSRTSALILEWNVKATCQYHQRYCVYTNLFLIGSKAVNSLVVSQPYLTRAGTESSWSLMVGLQRGYVMESRIKPMMQRSRPAPFRCSQVLAFLLLIGDGFDKARVRQHTYDQRPVTVNYISHFWYCYSCRVGSP